MIIIKFNPHPNHVVTSLDEMLYDNWSLLGGFEQAAKSMDKNLKSTRILDH